MKVVCRMLTLGVTADQPGVSTSAIAVLRTHCYCMNLVYSASLV